MAELDYLLVRIFTSLIVLFGLTFGGIMKLNLIQNSFVQLIFCLCCFVFSPAALAYKVDKIIPIAPPTLSEPHWIYKGAFDVANGKAYFGTGQVMNYPDEPGGPMGNTGYLMSIDLNNGKSRTIHVSRTVTSVVAKGNNLAFTAWSFLDDPRTGFIYWLKNGKLMSKFLKNDHWVAQRTSILNNSLYIAGDYAFVALDLKTAALQTLREDNDDGDNAIFATQDRIYARHDYGASKAEVSVFDSNTHAFLESFGVVSVGLRGNIEVVGNEIFTSDWCGPTWQGGVTAINLTTKKETKYPIKIGNQPMCVEEFHIEDNKIFALGYTRDGYLIDIHDMISGKDESIVTEGTPIPAIVKAPSSLVGVKVYQSKIYVAYGWAFNSPVDPHSGLKSKGGIIVLSAE